MASVVLVVVAAYGIILHNIYGMYLRDALSRYREQNIHVTGDFVNYILEGVNQAHYWIAHNENIIEVLTSPPELLPENPHIVPTAPILQDDEGLRWSDINRAIGHLFYVTVLSPALHSAYVYSSSNSHVISWTGFRNLYDFHDREFVENHREGLSFFVRTDMPGQQPIITLVRDVTHAGNIIGIAAVNIDYYQFASYVQQEVYGAPEIAIIADENGFVFYAIDRNLLSTNIRGHGVYGSAFSDAALNGISVMYRDDRVIASVRSANGFTIITTIESTEISDFRQNFTRFVLLGSAIGLLCAIFLAFGISLRLYGNMIRLVNLIGEAGDEASAPDRSYIIENITSLTAHNRHIEHELAEKLAELKKAQVVVLQNQINPHFILNTLQIVSLNIMSVLKSDSDATRTIALLSDILQSNLNTTDYMVKLGSEIRQTVKYLEIQRMRTKATFSVDWDIDDELMEYQTVKFVIQPILENCFKHGFVNAENAENIINIVAAKEGSTLTVKIRDNGRGMSPEVLSRLQDNLQQSHIKQNMHIGLCNVDKRIRLIFGENFGLTVTSALEEGTEVTIRQKIVK